MKFVRHNLSLRVLARLAANVEQFVTCIVSLNPSSQAEHQLQIRTWSILFCEPPRHLSHPRMVFSFVAFWWIKVGTEGRLLKGNQSPFAYWRGFMIGEGSRNKPSGHVFIETNLYSKVVYWRVGILSCTSCFSSSLLVISQFTFQWPRSVDTFVCHLVCASGQCNIITMDCSTSNTRRLSKSD